MSFSTIDTLAAITNLLEARREEIERGANRCDSGWSLCRLALAVATGELTPLEAEAKAGVPLAVYREQKVAAGLLSRESSDEWARMGR